jgi:dihydroxyacetone kinase-like predicted kinase
MVAVVPTRTAPQGFGAMLAFNPDGELEETVGDMFAASGEVATGEITRATRSVTLDGVEVEEGQYIGLVDGRLCASGSDMEQVLSEVLEGMEMAEREIVSVYYGADVKEQDAQAVADRIEGMYEDVEVELLPGGQAHYFYILGAE